MDTLTEFSHLATLTGSHAFGWATENSDIDWLISYEAFTTLELSGCEPEWYGDGFCCIRHGVHNFIVYRDDQHRDMWMAAHNYCLANPKMCDTKQKRKNIFRSRCGQGISNEAT